MNVPKLRFKEFNDEWIEEKINKLVELNPKNPNLPENFIYIDLESVSNGILLQEKIITKDDAPSRAQRQVKVNDILYQTVRPYQKNNLFIDKLSNLPYIASTGYVILREKNIYQKFLFNKLHTDGFVNEVLDNCTGTSYPAINSNDLGNIKIFYPNNFKEQKKIGDFLSLLDKKIELQSKKIEDLKLFKLSLREKLFYMFSTDNKKLSEILIKWNKKNKANKYSYVESVSNKFGFIAQNEQFEDRNVASNDTSNYYVIEKGVFAYNPSRLNVGSLALKQNDKISLVSPLYECFTTNQNQDFMLEWFQSKEFRRGTFSKYEGGVRNTLNFNNLSSIEINLPSIESQNKIVKVLSCYNKLIYLELAKLNKLQELKRGLMQQLFV